MKAVDKVRRCTIMIRMFLPQFLVEDVTLLILITDKLKIHNSFHLCFFTSVVLEKFHKLCSTYALRISKI